MKSLGESSFLRLPRRTRGGDRLILAYHNVVPADHSSIGDSSLHMPIDVFEAQLDVLREELEVIPLMDLLTGELADARYAAITFDDAYASALTLGVAACVRRGLPCTVFVAPGLLGTVPPWDLRALAGEWTATDRTHFLTVERGLARVTELAHGSFPPSLVVADESVLADLATETLVRFGNHTMRHANLTALSIAEVEEELGQADEWLHGRFSASHVPIVAYPYGAVPAHAERVLSQSGLRFGLAVEGGWLKFGQDHSHAVVPRWNVPASLSVSGFRVRLRGWLSR